MQRIQSARNVLLCVVLCGSALESAASGQSPSAQRQNEAVNRMSAAGRATMAKLDHEVAAWTTTCEVNGVPVIRVRTVSSPIRRRIVIESIAGGQSKELVRIIERDGLWYVTEFGRSTKWRPYEAILGMPTMYYFLQRSNLRVLITDGAATLGELESIDDEHAVYRAPAPEPIVNLLRGLEKSLVERMKSVQGENLQALSAQLTNLRSTLDKGLPVVVDSRNGVIVEAGVPGNTIHVSDFRWLQNNADLFDVNSIDWIDHSKPIVGPHDVQNNLVMFGHVEVWKPGERTDPAAVVLDLTSGELRRVPFQLGVAATGCFSANRRSVFVWGQMEEGGFGLFEVDLATGENRYYPAPDGSVLTLFPRLSPDGRTLAAISKTDQTSEILQTQIVLVDVASGKFSRLGPPLDTGPFSWLPDSSGLVLVSRAYPNPERPSVDTICRINLAGEITAIRPGTSPIAIPQSSRILFQDQSDDKWKTCALDGTDAKVLGDGLNDYGFPTVSPDGTLAVMMKFDPPRGPRPYLVRIDTGETRPIRVGAGLWSMPAWQ